MKGSRDEKRVKDLNKHYSDTIIIKKKLKDPFSF